MHSQMIRLGCSVQKYIQVNLNNRTLSKTLSRQDKKLIRHDKMANTVQSPSADAYFLQQILPLFVDPPWYPAISVAVLSHFRLHLDFLKCDTYPTETMVICPDHPAHFPRSAHALLIAPSVASILNSRSTTTSSETRQPPFHALLLLEVRRERLVVVLPARGYREDHRPEPSPEHVPVREHLPEHSRDHGGIIPVDAAPERGQDEVGASP
mmetsp:Transcript_37145/g.79201  ORF Transcript_37145/g.79201 Transcript_37145/m.79201 type:complete len:210 (+) Transcript_37145:53-682(+)